MIDGERGDLESVLFEYRRRTACAWRGAGWSIDFHGERLHLPVLGGHQRNPVMRDAIAFIQRVGLFEAVHHLIDADRPVHAQRMVPSVRPRLDVEFAEIADVIGMKCVNITAAMRGAGMCHSARFFHAPGPISTR